MGTKAAEALDVSFDELPNYLHAKHSVYMEIGSETYYLTDVNDRYWRAQDTAKLNEKGHYVDASERVPTHLKKRNDDGGGRVNGRPRFSFRNRVAATGVRSAR